MWYFQNLKQSFIEWALFVRHAQPFIGSGLTPWFCYPFSWFLGLVVFATCLFGGDYYFRSPKKKAILEQGFGAFGVRGLPASPEEPLTLEEQDDFNRKQNQEGT